MIALLLCLLTSPRAFAVDPTGDRTMPTAPEPPVPDVEPEFKTSIRLVRPGTDEATLWGHTEHTPLVLVELHVTNRGNVALSLPDFTAGGVGAVAKLTLPSGAVREFPVGRQPQGGVVPQQVRRLVLPGARDTFAQALPPQSVLGEVGTCALTLAYTWRAGQTYRSPIVTFTLAAPESLPARTNP